MKLADILSAVYEKQRIRVHDQYGYIIFRGVRKLMYDSILDSEVIEIASSGSVLIIEVIRWELVTY